MVKRGMRIGWASADVTPEGTVNLRGQFHVRITDEVRDPLTATALALESDDGSEQAIIVSLDAVAVADYVTLGCRKALAAALPGFDPDKLFISATHTHTAPEQPGPILAPSPELGDEVMTAEAYGDLLVERISSAAVEAWNSRKPGALGWARGHAVVGFNRRVSYFDGSTAMYGKTDLPEFSHIEGHEDHGVELLFTYDATHSLTGMIVNVPCPSQCTEGASFVSADYWHETRQEIRKRHGEQLFVLAQCAAAGDQSPRCMVNRRAEARMLALKGYGDDYNEARRRDIADEVAAAVDEAVPLAAKDIRDEVVFGHQVLAFDLKQRRATPEDVAVAEKEVADWTLRLESFKGEGPSSARYSGAFRRVGFNRNVIDMFNAQQRGERLVMPVELHCLRIGDIAMCTNRFEYYLDFGMRTKGRSKALQTFIVQLAGPGSYLPTDRSMAGGSYGAYIASTPIGPEGGQVVVEEQVAAINEMFAGEPEA